MKLFSPIPSQVAQLHRLLAMMDVALEAAAETTENVFAKSQVRFFHLTLGPCSCCSMTFIGFLLSYSGKNEKVALAILQQDAGDFRRLHDLQSWKATR